jgi:serine protease Do
VLRDGQRVAVSLTTGERPGEATAHGSRAPQGPHGRRAQPSNGFGLAVEPLTPDVARQIGYRGEGKVVIANVTPGSTSDRANLKRGDVIISADRHAVNAPADVVNALADGQAMLQVERGEGAFFVVLAREQ